MGDGGKLDPDPPCPQDALAMGGCERPPKVKNVIANSEMRKSRRVIESLNDVKTKERNPVMLDRLTLICMVAPTELQQGHDLGHEKP
jgi:hypothetical protein